MEHKVTIFIWEMWIWHLLAAENGDKVVNDIHNYYFVNPVDPFQFSSLRLYLYACHRFIGYDTCCKSSAMTVAKMSNGMMKIHAITLIWCQM